MQLASLFTLLFAPSMPDSRADQVILLAEREIPIEESNCILLRCRRGVLYWFPGTYTFNQHRLRWAQDADSLVMEAKT